MRTAVGEEFRCRARGRLRLDNRGLYVGDRAIFEPLTKDEGVLEKIEPRQTLLLRPPVANIEQVIIVTALQNPPISVQLLDRLLVLAESRQISAIIYFNKDDLPHEDMSNLSNLYTHAGYIVYFTSAKFGQGIESLQKKLCGRISVLAGPSGAGKSSLINKIQPGLKLRVGDISEKNKRGKHTTRHVELLPLDCGGFVADSPGFSQLELDDISSNTLTNYFPEFIPFARECRFNTCKHAEEPDCAVKTAVSNAQIAQSRHENYLVFLSEVKQQERSY